RLMPPYETGSETQHETERYGEDHHRDLRLSEHPAYDGRIERVAEGAHDENCRWYRKPEGEPQELLVRQPKADIRSEHHEVALGEVDGLRGLVDQHEAERDQTIDAAVG